MITDEPDNDLSAPPQTTNVFTYGSLMYPDIFAAVSGVSVGHRPAKAINWRRYALKERTYPGAIAENGACIEGVLWFGVPADAVSRLDQFEGEEYCVQTLFVYDTAGIAHRAIIYRWRKPDLIFGDWSTQDFERNHRDTFVAVHLSASESEQAPSVARQPTDNQ